MVSAIEMCERSECKHRVNQFYPEQMEEYKIGDDIGRVDIDGCHDPQHIIIHGRIDIRELNAKIIEHKKYGRITPNPDKIENNGP